jgi:hypothetical protein
MNEKIYTDGYGRIFKDVRDRFTADNSASYPPASTKDVPVSLSEIMPNFIIDKLIGNIAHTAKNALLTDDLTEKHRILELCIGLSKAAADYAFSHTPEGRD